MFQAPEKEIANIVAPNPLPMRPGPQDQTGVSIKTSVPIVLVKNHNAPSAFVYQSNTKPFTPHELPKESKTVDCNQEYAHGFPSQAIDTVRLQQQCM